MTIRFLCAYLAIWSVAWSCPKSALAQIGVGQIINDDGAVNSGARSRFACVCTCSGLGGSGTVIFDSITEKKECKKLSNGKKDTLCFWHRPAAPGASSKSSGPLDGKEFGEGVLTNCNVFAIPTSLADIVQPK